MLTTEQLKLINKFGFQVKSDSVIHVKTGLSFPTKEIAHYATIQELEAILKNRLKNQCHLKRRPGV
ncbi:hypothetical protein ACQCN2_19935 [Brevibacillus ginsengisoli]|uniref:hypothetical protein n=1 Tax=Brevibacillus ginsengisoli TaxID=363854 RepID=UPI003CED9E48